MKPRFLAAACITLTLLFTAGLAGAQVLEGTVRGMKLNLWSPDRQEFEAGLSGLMDFNRTHPPIFKCEVVRQLVGYLIGIKGDPKGLDLDEVDRRRDKVFEGVYRLDDGFFGHLHAIKGYSVDFADIIDRIDGENRSNSGDWMGVLKRPDGKADTTKPKEFPNIIDPNH